jgi:heme exporter protein D
MSEFFAMGGYAAYVWPCYAVFVLIFVAHIVAPRLAKQAVLREVLLQKRRKHIKTQNQEASE